MYAGVGVLPDGREVPAAISVGTKPTFGEHARAVEAFLMFGTGWRGCAAQAASGTGHPAVWLLFPVPNKDLNKEPALSKREGNHWVLTVTQPVNAGGKKGAIGIALTLIGVSPSA